MSRNDALIAALKKEIDELTRGEFDVRYASVVTADWTLEGVTSAVDRLLADPDVDIFLAMGGCLCIVIFLVIGFVVAIRQARNAQEPLLTTASEKVSVDINNPDIRWIPLNKRKIRLLKFATLLPLLLIPVVLLVFMTADKISSTVPIAAMIFMIAFIPFLTFNAFKIGLGTLGDILVIKKSDKQFAAARSNDIFFSDTHILIDQVYIPFSHQQLLFETEPVIKEVMPLLRDATYIQGGQMMNMMLKRQKPWRIVALFVFAMVFIAILMVDIYK